MGSQNIWWNYEGQVLPQPTNAQSPPIICQAPAVGALQMIGGDCERTPISTTSLGISDGKHLNCIWPSKLDSFIIWRAKQVGGLWLDCGCGICMARRIEQPKWCCVNSEFKKKKFHQNMPIMEYLVYRCIYNITGCVSIIYSLLSQSPLQAPVTWEILKIEFWYYCLAACVVIFSSSHFLVPHGTHGNLWVGRCVSSWWPWFPSRSSV